jgi:hypothetical protein
MSITISITCDGSDCGLTEETSSDLDSGTNELEAQLEPGWVHDGAENHCPKCALELGLEA